MSARTLPSLQHLKNEAKQLHMALTTGDADAGERARANPRRLSVGDAVVEVSLQEAQHILGREYGFQDWLGLAAELTNKLAGAGSQELGGDNPWTSIRYRTTDATARTTSGC